MKKLLFFLTVMLAFCTMTFASNKMTTTTLKAPIKKEILKTKKVIEQQECVTLRTDTPFEIVDGEVVWGETVIRVRIDWNCLGNPAGLGGIWVL